MGEVRDFRRIIDRPFVREGGRGSPSFLLLFLAIVAVPIVSLLGATQIYRSAYAGRIYLGVSAGSVDLGGYTPAQAVNVLVARFQQYANTPIALRFGNQEWKATAAEMGMRFDVEETVNSAFAVGRSGGFVSETRAQLEAWRNGEAAKQPVFRLDPAQRGALFERLGKEINRPATEARLTLLPSEFRTKLTSSQPGRALNVDKTMRHIEEAIAAQSVAPIILVVDDVGPAVVEAELQATQALAEKMMSGPLTARFEDQSWTIERSDIADLLSLRDQPGADPRYNVEIADQPLQRLVGKMAKAINRPPSNARFDYTNGQLKVIREGVDGRTLDVAGTISALKARLSSDDRTFTLPIKLTKPAIGAGDADKLAIAGLIEQDSTEYGYGGALPERVYNVELAASRLNGVVVAPGETFSFNDEVGLINTLAGFKVGFGITQEGGSAITVPSVGGGICQVATTLFHPVFWAGYPIGDRVPHLYWIPRYGVPPKGLTGLDTTVDQVYDKDGNLLYAVDFTFKNTTATPILIQAKTDGRNLTFALLGTKPTWQVKVDQPVITNVVPKNNTTERQENPDWTAGKTVVIEEARDGFKVSIVRTVTQDGKVIDKRNFAADYQATKNVVMVGTKKDPSAPATPTTPVAKTTPAPATTPPAGAKPAATPTKAPAATPTPTAKPR